MIVRRDPAPRRAPARACARRGGAGRVPGRAVAVPAPGDGGQRGEPPAPGHRRDAARPAAVVDRRSRHRPAGDELRRHPDPVQAVRLQLDVAVARLAEGNVSGHPVPAGELIETVARFRDEPLLDDRRLHGLVGGFVDLATAQESPPDEAVDRLIVAVARRRVRAQVDHDHGRPCTPGAAVLTLGAGTRTRPSTTCSRRWGGCRTGATAPSSTPICSRSCPHSCSGTRRGPCRSAGRGRGRARGLAPPPAAAPGAGGRLAHSPFGSDTALIGQAAHVFQGLAEEHAGLDRSVISRTDETRSELLRSPRRRCGRPQPCRTGTRRRRR